MRTASERRKAYEDTSAHLPDFEWPGGNVTEEEIEILRKACAVRFDESVRTETLFYIASAAVRIFKAREKAAR